MRKQTQQRQHRHRLAAAALARDAENLRLLQVIVDAVDESCESRGRRQLHAQLLHLEHRAHSPLPPPHDVCGSRTSRRLSPRKLKASTAEKMARPGKVPIHHHWKYCAPSATIEPHSGSGGCAPSPRNESPASSRIAPARSSVASTSTGPATFGATSRNSVRRADEPSSRADSTYSDSPTESTSPRTTRAYAGHATMTIASAAFR